MKLCWIFSPNVLFLFFPMSFLGLGSLRLHHAHVVVPLLRAKPLFHFTVVLGSRTLVNRFGRIFEARRWLNNVDGFASVFYLKMGVMFSFLGENYMDSVMLPIKSSLIFSKGYKPK